MGAWFELTSVIFLSDFISLLWLPVVGSRAPVTVDPERLLDLTRLSGGGSAVVLHVLRSGFGWRFVDLQFGRALHGITKPYDRNIIQALFFIRGIVKFQLVLPLKNTWFLTSLPLECLLNRLGQDSVLGYLNLWISLQNSLIIGYVWVTDREHVL